MNDDYNGDKLFSKLKGRVIKNITGIDDQYPDRLHFEMGNGAEFVMYHSQDCCEGVKVEDVIGDWKDIIGSKITLAEVVTNSKEHPKDYKVGKYENESYTWTFYKLSTIKGSITIRWLGTSNGYYSEAVTFCKLGEEN